MINVTNVPWLLCVTVSYQTLIVDTVEVESSWSDP